MEKVDLTQEEMGKCKTGEALESCGMPEQSIKQDGHDTSLPTKERGKMIGCTAASCPLI